MVFAARNPAMGSLRRAAFQFASDFNARGAFFSDLTAVEAEPMDDELPDVSPA
jgi:hypothetical protein